MKSLDELACELGLAYGELLPVGQKMAKIDYIKALKRLKQVPQGKYIDVTAITPTPFGEGKTTATIGLIQGIGKLKKNVVGAIRQASGGPTFNIKGSAAGGGLAQCIPLTPFSIRLTGDIECVTNAHNLAMVA
ncbi:MAG: formate--tetrahydrofolate ligase, partial [Promethearchaeota archaeon]